MSSQDPVRHINVLEKENLSKNTFENENPRVSSELSTEGTEARMNEGATKGYQNMGQEKLAGLPPFHDNKVARVSL